VQLLVMQAGHRELTYTVILTVVPKNAANGIKTHLNQKNTKLTI